MWEFPGWGDYDRVIDASAEELEAIQRQMDEGRHKHEMLGQWCAAGGG
jgi:hypothetical protein